MKQPQIKKPKKDPKKFIWKEGDIEVITDQSRIEAALREAFLGKPA